MILIQIGNSDDKLSQYEWSQFCAFIDSLVELYAERIWGKWFTAPDVQWQGACYAFDEKPGCPGVIAHQLAIAGRDFRQDEIALVTGTTTMITPAGTDA